MIFGLYIIYDNIAKEGGHVITAKNDETAIRQLINLIRDNHYMNPKEYQLFKVGEYEAELLTIEPHKKEIDFQDALKVFTDKKASDMISEVFNTSVQGKENAKYL